MENKGMKVLVHASAFFAPYLVPIIIFLISEDETVKKVSIQAVLFQLVIGVLITLSIIFSFLLIGIPFLIGFGIMWLVVPIIGIVKALNDEDYNYPIVGRWYQ
ncbi:MULTISPECIES: DUF4870 domain-containing protein [Sporosarcina]|uniref:Uncharacterized protein conserved in bacteria n=2 Tax=Sporosarcina TaxID=1569 RepID=A0A380C8K2_SPOPA|nr:MULTISPECIES: DUF4870 domain-containing protein [Sporosarcina]AOV07147.1 hypothetical protein BI350_06070 [Sporosarcina ureilytica]MDS9473081.1 DUF4870 domain-containing protein [Sporosarcina pasteurii]QBQ04585.1 DUF4870 domain-containing protein [Sporosarcina pasteurii]SUJ13990.1 Uncharacterized protein conserved in bacteria [Sporosarcina pasteurii]